MPHYLSTSLADDAAGASSSSSRGKKAKKEKKGFKADRCENFRRMMLRKSGSGSDKSKGASATAATTTTTRVKSVTFDEAQRREYLLTLHKKKNERRVQAFVDAKRKQKKEHAKTRREQREEARRAYNNYARVPILPDYTYRLPRYLDGDDDDGDGDEREADRTAAVVDGDGDNVKPTAEEQQQQQRRQRRRLVTAQQTTHAMPQSMHEQAQQGDDGDEDNDDARAAATHADDACVVVEVKPLRAHGIACTSHNNNNDDADDAQAHALPSHDFSDLPAVVAEELRRLRNEEKGPTRTRPRVHMLRELQKIRKIKKHSRKGHNKRRASGKRKNRRK